MTERTAEYYEQNAAELSRRYETTALDSFHELLNKTFTAGSRLLEIGFGSGRDAARALTAGFDLAAIDGSQSLLAEAVRLHPELNSRLQHVRLPSRLPFDDRSFAGFFSVACLMHFTGDDLLKILGEISRVTKPSGKGLVSVPAGRSDVNSNGLDQHGRIFNVMPATSWQKLFSSCGFASEPGPVEPDSLGRDGITWVTFLLHKE